MRVKEITVPITIVHDDGSEQKIEVAGKFQEIESLDELVDVQMSAADKVRCFNYGRDLMERGRLRSANNFGSLAKKLVETKVFESTKEALEFILRRRDSK